jgi:type I restriction enzyme S subunit
VQASYGSVQQNIASRKTVEDIKINLPPINEQERIISILSSLDGKIELNLQMNMTLESIAQAIFKEWFVDFRFPGFVGELMGGLPRGWREGRLGEDFKLLMGQSPPGVSYNEIGAGKIFFQGRTDFGFRFPENRMYTTAPNRMAEKLDTLVSVRAPVGDINMAKENCCIGRGLSAVRHTSGAYSYTYYMMKSIDKIFKGYEGEGTVFGSINKTNFENISVVIPDRQVIEYFEKLINPIDQRILLNSNEIATLTTIRDTLLPKLMTGKIRTF